MTPELMHTFELRCGDVHPIRCDVALRGASSEELTDRARAHGALVHGFTPAWYSSARLGAIARACTRSVPQ